MAGESTGFNAAPSAQAALPGAAPTPSSAGKGGGGGSLPMSEYPFVPQWMQQRSQSPTGASNAVTPAINPGQGAGRFMSNSPASAPQGSSNLMGGQMTPTATPIVRPNPATAFRPTVTPSIYDEWKGYTAAAQASNAANKAEAGGGIVQSGPYKGMTVQDASKFDNFTVLNPEYANLAASYRG